MYQVCICPDKQCPIHGEPVPYTLTTSSTSSPVFSEATPPKENTDLKEQIERDEWIADQLCMRISGLSAGVIDGGGDINDLKFVNKLYRRIMDIVMEDLPRYKAVEKLVHQARVSELEWVSSQLVSIPCEENCTPERHAHHQGSWDMCREIEGDITRRIKELESKEETD